MFSVFVSLLSASYAINSFFRWEKCLDAKRNGQFFVLIIDLRHKITDQKTLKSETLYLKV
ncbi:hypothetical protein AMQ68_15020 [Chryseobacterium sp. ERMR1:04]|nr:hypothetical protein AMQ68_15020 [Chryseobacterium sp. ERMR1:04]